MAGTREDRIARQARDRGGPEDTVYLSSDSAAKTYHNDRDCRFLRAVKGVVGKSRKVAKLAWKAPCQTCVLDGGDDS